ncbi:MAG: hypothetical protein ACFHVJ_07320 [Aestuariibacter sp.]
MAFLKLTIRFFMAVLVCFMLASIFHSQFVLIELLKLGVNIPVGDWISMTISDLLGLLPGYGGIITIALLLAFLIMQAIHKWLINLPDWRYPMAGFLALTTALLAMQPLLGVTLIAGARTELGFFSQCLAGAIGGLFFMWLQRQAQRH